MTEMLTTELRARGIAFELTPFPTAVRTVDGVAAALGISARQVGKSMLVEAAGALKVAVLPGDDRLSLRAVRELCGVESAELVPREQLEIRTGLEPGAVTPLIALVRSDVDVLLEEALLDHDSINISSGDSETGLSLNPRDLVAAVAASTGRLART